MNDADWMQAAITLAQRAEREGEVPVGAVLVRDDERIGAGWNQPIARHDASAHAEILAMRHAAERARNYRLPGATLYVTLEPCVMCAGAIIQARIHRLVFGAYDHEAGAAGTVFSIAGTDKLNHRIIVTGGLLEEGCSRLLREFFKKRR